MDLPESVLFSFGMNLLFNKQILIMLYLTTEFFVFFPKSNCKMSDILESARKSASLLIFFRNQQKCSAHLGTLLVERVCRTQLPAELRSTPVPHTSGKFNWTPPKLSLLNQFLPQIRNNPLNFEAFVSPFSKFLFAQSRVKIRMKRVTSLQFWVWGGARNLREERIY